MALSHGLISPGFLVYHVSRRNGVLAGPDHVHTNDVRASQADHSDIIPRRP